MGIEQKNTVMGFLKGLLFDFLSLLNPEKKKDIIRNKK